MTTTRHYVVSETLAQADESPFATREAAEEWIAARQGSGIRWCVLTEAEMAEADAEMSAPWPR